MNLPILYIKNLAIAFGRLARATVGKYKYNPQYSYSLNWWRTVDCLGNAILGGDPDETISSRVAKARDAGDEWACVFCKFLTWCQNTIFRKPGDHCAIALSEDVGHRAVVPDDSGTNSS